MSIGMSYDEYWYGDPNLVISYFEAHKYRQKAINERLWLQGLYFGHAVASVLNGRKSKYPEKPLDIYPKTIEEKRAEAEEQRKKVIDFFNSYKQRWNNGNNR